MGSIETNYIGPFALIGDGKVLVFPLLPKPYFYNIQTINDSSTLSVVADPSIKHDNLEIELTFLILEEVNELFANENTFSSQHSLKPTTEPRMSPVSDFFIQLENGTRFTTNFHNLTPGDLSNWTFTDSSSIMVIDGILMFDYTSDKLDLFLIGENATREPIALEDASKLNKSDWIYDGKLFYRIVKLNEEYIKDIIVELKGTLNNFQTGDFFSTVQIKIEVSESAITQKYTDDKTVLSNLTLNYNEKSTIVKYDYEENAYLFTDDIVLIGKSYLYPFDYYTTSIGVTGGELIQEHQQFKSQDSGFNLDVDFNNNNITIKKSRKILPRYFLSIIILIIVGYILNKFYIRKKRHQFASKDIVELSFFVLAALGFTLYLAFDNYNYVYSLGIVPFLIFVLFIIFSFYINNKSDIFEPLP
ncbi:MAG TPA: hypothetical protein VMW53_06940 [archaeon]|nr:hypothetical protein [archaeon]